MSVENFVRLEELDSGLYRLVLDAPKVSVNVLCTKMIKALAEVIERLPSNTRGLLITSAKPGFVAGADITEFRDNFAMGTEHIFSYGQSVQALFNRIEDLPFPTLSAIRGQALGGGLELALATDFRVMTENARIGLPEVSLGIMPGWGGTVRLPRLIGIDNSFTWMTQGMPVKAQEALKAGAVNAVVQDDQLEVVGLNMLRQSVAGKLDYLRHRRLKSEPLLMSDQELAMACDTTLGMLSMTVGPHYPAAETIVRSVRAGVRLPREAALEQEGRDFSQLATSPVALSLVNLFQNEQQLKRRNRHLAGDAQSVAKGAVLGAGIMGGGVAYQSASTGTPILMKDISQDAIELGMGEVNRLLGGQVKRGKLKTEQVLEIAQRIEGRLDYSGFGDVGLVVEAVVENGEVKRAVLAEVEAKVDRDCVLATNTSTLQVSDLAVALERPENLCGMHFFNPVHRMPLVEIVRGEQSSDLAIGKAVSYALAMKKVPIVVRDCPGFLVNRILLPYIHAFTRLVVDGIDFERIDRVMAAFGWPMGPATLMDVVGMDTGCHSAAIMGQAYPDRMSDELRNATHVLYEAGRLGQKSGAGYYVYKKDARGKLKKVSDPEAHSLISSVVTGNLKLNDEQIVQRMMIPLCLEAMRCLEEGVAESAAAIDVALINGIGFPRYLGGAFGYMERLGLHCFVEQCNTYKALGSAYQPSGKLCAMATSGESFYSSAASAAVLS